MTTVGIIGAGYWGPNLIRNFNQLSTIKYVADLNDTALGKINATYPKIKTTKDYNDILNDPEITAVIIATPEYTHYEIGMKFLNAGKHCFIEKPITLDSKEAEELAKLAKEKNLVLMTGHTFLYNEAVRYAKELIDSGELGDILYIRANRLSLGLFREHANVLYDLGPHDISIILYWLGALPSRVAGTGGAHITPGMTDVASFTLDFEDLNVQAFVQNSWIDPNKVRDTVIVGTKKMLVYDDMEPNEKIRIYDKKVEAPPHADTFAEWQYSYHYGDILIPKINLKEPLRTEAQHFLDCIKNGEKPLSDGINGYNVVKIIEAINKSIDDNGSFISL